MPTMVAHARPAIHRSRALGTLLLLCSAFLIPGPAEGQSDDPQRQTQLELERVGVAALTWVIDQVRAGEPLGGGGQLDITDYPTISAMDLEDLLVPACLDCLPTVDGWGNPYDFRLDVMNPFSEAIVALRSSGADGQVEGDLYSVGYVSTQEEDLVWADGFFVRSAPDPDPQARTLADLQSIGQAMFAWLSDQPFRDNRGSGLGQVDLSTFPTITAQDLEGLLVPRYLAFLPTTDGWGNLDDFWLEQDLFNPLAMAIRSPGSDGISSGPVYDYGYGSTAAEDLVWANGLFIRRPLPTGIEALTVTVAQASQIGTAMFSWVIDQTSLQPSKPKNESIAGAVDMDDFSPISYGDLEALLVPGYLAVLPEVDGWGHLYLFWLDTLDLLGPELLAVVSTGADGLFGGPIYEPGGFPFYRMDEDVVQADGVLVRFPQVEVIFADGFECGDASAWTAIVP